MNPFKLIQRSAIELARASDCNPIISTVVVILFFFMFNLLEAQIETLIWGARFEHWLDPLFISMFIGYAAYSVYWCGLFRDIRERDNRVTISGDNK